MPTVALLLTAAAPGPRPASTVMLVVGTLFLLSGLVNLGLLRTGFVDERPATPTEVAGEQEMRAAEIAVVNHTATPEQGRRVAAMAQVRSRSDRRQVWLDGTGTRAG